MNTSTGKNKRKYTLEEKDVLGRDFAVYGDYVTPEAKKIVSSNQASQPSNSSSNSYGISSTFTPSANYTNAMNLTNSLLSHMVKTKPVDSMKAMIADIQNRPKFSYDINKDPMFQQALSSAQKSGKTAMKDTMGQAAALTGGYGSSYSAAVGNQAYNNHLQQVYDNAPQYYNMALQKYQMETEDLYRQYALLSEANNAEYQMLLDLYNMNYGQAQDIYNKEYAAWRDANDLAYRERDWNYGVGRDTVTDQRYADEFAYQKERDIVADQRYEDELEYARGRDDINDTRYAEELAYQKGRDIVADQRYENEWENTLTQQSFENQLRGDLNTDGTLSADEISYLQTTTDNNNSVDGAKLSNGKDLSYMPTYKSEALSAYYTNNGDEYLDSLGLNEAERKEIENYVSEHTLDNPMWVGGEVGTKKFDSRKGDNFDIEYNSKDYTVENKGKVENKDTISKLIKINAKNNEMILYNGAWYFKHDGEFYKIGNPRKYTSTEDLWNSIMQGEE